MAQACCIQAAFRFRWFDVGWGKYQGCDRREAHGERAPELQQLAVLEMDGLGTRTAAGARELQVIRDAAGAALGGLWELGSRD